MKTTGAEVLASSSKTVTTGAAISSMVVAVVAPQAATTVTGVAKANRMTTGADTRVAASSRGIKITDRVSRGAVAMKDGVAMNATTVPAFRKGEASLAKEAMEAMAGKADMALSVAGATKIWVARVDGRIPAKAVDIAVHTVVAKAATEAMAEAKGAGSATTIVLVTVEGRGGSSSLILTITNGATNRSVRLMTTTNLGAVNGTKNSPTNFRDGATSGEAPTITSLAAPPERPVAIKIRSKRACLAFF